MSENGIIIHLENNSKLDPLFSDPEEVKLMFEKNPNVEFLLDVAHIDNYDHLKAMMKIKKPKILHIADRHLEVIHEHLPIGQGNIDYNYSFKNVLSDFDGRIILEIVQSSKDIIESKLKIEEYYRK